MLQIRNAQLSSFIKLMEPVTVGILRLNMIHMHIFSNFLFHTYTYIILTMIIFSKNIVDAKDKIVKLFKRKTYR